MPSQNVGTCNLEFRFVIKKIHTTLTDTEFRMPIPFPSLVALYMRYKSQPHLALFPLDLSRL